MINSNANPFVRFFNIYRDSDGILKIAATPELFGKIRCLNSALKHKKYSYADLCISKEYWLSFKKKTAQTLIVFINDLQSCGKGSNDCRLICSGNYDDFDLLDGIIKSAIQNQVVRWDDLKINKTDFDSLIEDSKEKALKKSFETWEEATELLAAEDEEEEDLNEENFIGRQLKLNGFEIGMEYDDNLEQIDEERLICLTPNREIWEIEIPEILSDSDSVDFTATEADKKSAATENLIFKNRLKDCCRYL